MQLTWPNLSSQKTPKQPPNKQKKWWEIERNKLLSLAATHSPCHVYHLKTLLTKSSELLSMQAIDQCYYAVKANPHPALLACLYEKGVNFECVSTQELTHLLSLFPNLNKKRLLFTPNFAPRSEYEFALSLGCYITIDSLYPLENWSNLFENKPILLRIDLGSGAGHHKYVHTAGKESKFGIPLSELSQAVALTQKYSIQVIGLHSHSGSGILNAAVWKQTAEKLLALAHHFPDLSIINLGGGLGIPEKPDEKALDLKRLDKDLLRLKNTKAHLNFWLEPGRFFVAESGVLLAKVTQCKEKNNVRFIGIETGMNSLLRPSLYGAYHEIVNLTRLFEARKEQAHVVGPICESGDTLGYDRLFPKTKEQDIFLIANVGAYGHSMSSNYNLRPPAQEIILC